MSFGFRRGRRGRGRARAPAQTRQAVSVTLTRYVPPAVPRPRERAPRFRVCLQLSVDLTGSGAKEIAPLPSLWFGSEYSTSGFDAVLFHRLAFWTVSVAPASGQDLFPEMTVHYRLSSGVETYPSYTAVAAGYNLAARLGFHIPSHMSGPYAKGSTTAFCRVSANDIVTRVRIEADVTFI